MDVVGSALLLSRCDLPRDKVLTMTLLEVLLWQVEEEDDKDGTGLLFKLLRLLEGEWEPIDDEQCFLRLLLPLP